jgi:hypothetical protein
MKFLEIVNGVCVFGEQLNPLCRDGFWQDAVENLVDGPADVFGAVNTTILAVLSSSWKQPLVFPFLNNRLPVWRNDQHPPLSPPPRGFKHLI